MSNRHHSAIEELVAADVLDALDPEEGARLRSLVAEHGDCDECRGLEAGFHEAAALLAASLPPEPVDLATADRILEAAPRGGRTHTDELAARRRRRPVATAVGAVAAVALVALATGALLRPRIAPTTAAWDQRVVTFSASGAGTGGHLGMAYSPDHPGVAVWGSDLPDPGPDKTYELWMIAAGTPTSGGCLHPREGHVEAFVDASLGTSQEMAVTVEPSSCPAEPTSAPVLTARLS